MPDDWDEIHGFASQAEFERFRRWIREARNEGELVQLPVASPYGGTTAFEEYWYKARSGSTWRLVAPEPPFRGVFERLR